MNKYNIRAIKNKKNYHNYAMGGVLDNEEEYTPATLAGYITKQVTGNQEKAANADIVSSTINTGADTIPVIGNAIGIGLSIGDTLYDTGKFIINPSWKNLSDIGTSIFGIIPGIGTVRDAKNIHKATKQIIQNVKTTRKLKAAQKTLMRRPNTTRINILKPNMKVQRSYKLPIPNAPYKRAIGTIGNTTDTMEDTWQGGSFLWTPNLTLK